MTDNAPGPAATAATTISRRWMLKVVIGALVLLGFGIAGFYDAIVKYPRQGATAAQWLEYQYLDLYSRERPPLDSRAGIADPGTERDRLARNEREKGALDHVDRALKNWLDALALVSRLDGPTATAIPRTDFRGVEVKDARTRLADLSKTWTATQGGQPQAPSELSPWDIPVQWLIGIGGVAIGLYLTLLFLRVRARVYRWN